jgi:hypothetical protein
MVATGGIMIVLFRMACVLALFAPATMLAQNTSLPAVQLCPRRGFRAGE